MKRHFSILNLLFSSLLTVIFFVFNAAAQSSVIREKAVVESSSGDRWFFMMLILVLCGLGGAYYFWRKSRASLEKPAYNYKDGSRDRHENAVVNDVDANEELEWLRKATQSGRAAKTRREPPKTASPRSDTDDLTMYTKTFQEKMRRLQYSQLPINGFPGMAPAPPFEELPVSRDPGLLSAIEQANLENEDDEVIREFELVEYNSFLDRCARAQSAALTKVPEPAE